LGWNACGKKCHHILLEPAVFWPLHWQRCSNISAWISMKWSYMWDRFFFCEDANLEKFIFFGNIRRFSCWWISWSFCFIYFVLICIFRIRKMEHFSSILNKLVSWNSNNFFLHTKFDTMREWFFALVAVVYLFHNSTNELKNVFGEREKMNETKN